MDIVPQIFTAKVMHKRLFPKVNQFVYDIYYLALPLSKMEEAAKRGLSINRPAPLSFYNRDHANRNDQEDLQQWITGILKEHDLNNHISSVVLVSMPRVLGYVFNPVSFWLCLDSDNNIRAVLNEVNNTFGETHSYLCAHKNGVPIDKKEWLEAQKLFHVSPFLEREGHYKFRYELDGERLGIWIDFYNEENNKKLITSLTGTLMPLTKRNLRYVFWRYPLVTLKSIYLIHWQAFKLVLKRARYYRKPEQLTPKISQNENLTKM